MCGLLSISLLYLLIRCRGGRGNHINGEIENSLTYCSSGKQSFLTREGGLCKGQMFIALAGGVAWFIMSIGNYIFCCRHRRKEKKSGGDQVNNDGGFMMNSYAPGGHHGVQHRGFSGHIGDTHYPS
ncbi:hypothetical protein V8F33_011753 [Rhypophila sp. PSN 637]